MAKSNRAFFEKVMTEVKALPLTEVVAEYIEVKENKYADNDAICPFHADEKFGSFKINDGKNLYKCFACDEHGDGINFVMNHMKIGFKEAVIEMAYTHHIISKKQSEELLGGTVTDKKIVTVKKKKKVEDDSIVGIGSNELLNKVFRVLMSLTDLSEEHRLLLVERGLSEEDIEKAEYFTFPEAKMEVFQEIYKCLKEVGINPQDLKHVPGFATSEHLKEVKGNETRYLYTFFNQRGLGIPVKNANGEIVGLQIRKDKIEGDVKRYHWFSSGFTERKNIYKHGTTAGAPVHVSYPTENKYKSVAFITEGIFKSECVSKTFHSTCLSLQGVASYKKVIEQLRFVEEKQGKLEHIYIAFDADLASNVVVYKHLRSMVDLIKEEFPNIKMYQSLWNEDKGKGIDDLIIAGEQSHLKRVPIDEFVEKYDVVIDELEKEYEKQVTRIDKELVKEAFMSKVYTSFIKNLA